MSKNSKKTKRNQDWRDVLSEAKEEIERNLSEEEKKELQLKKAQAEERNKKLQEIKPLVYRFLAGYKQNSGIFVNNFFRGRDFKLYEEDKFYDFDIDLYPGSVLPNVFDDFEFSLQMVRYLHELDQHKEAYHPINPNFIRALTGLALALDYSPRIEKPTILYRGCSTIERNGVNGIVSTTRSYEIARQFSRGTILKIHVPEGTKALDVVKIRPRKQRKHDLEDELLLPPCEYTVISEKKIKNNREPNNHFYMTNIIEIEVKPLDLLEEFLKAMNNPPKEYKENVMPYLGKEYEEAVLLLKLIIEKRSEENLFL